MHYFLCFSPSWVHSLSLSAHPAYSENVRNQRMQQHDGFPIVNTSYKLISIYLIAIPYILYIEIDRYSHVLWTPFPGNKHANTRQAKFECQECALSVSTTCQWILIKEQIQTPSSLLSPGCQGWWLYPASINPCRMWKEPGNVVEVLEPDTYCAL